MTDTSLIARLEEATGLSRQQRGEIAATLTRFVWESRRAEVIEYLTHDRPGKRFSRAGADRAFHSFIETMAFVAEETGIPQLGGKP